MSKYYLDSLPLLFMYLFYFTSCTESDNKLNLLLSDTLLVDYHLSLTNDELDLELKFENVLEDSRCPEGIVCFWEGNAVIEFIFINGNHSANIVLNTASGFRKDTLLFDYRIELIRVYPYPVYEEILELVDYSSAVLIKNQE